MHCITLVILKQHTFTGIKRVILVKIMMIILQNKIVKTDKHESVNARNCEIIFFEVLYLIEWNWRRFLKFWFESYMIWQRVHFWHSYIRWTNLKIGLPQYNEKGWVFNIDIESTTLFLKTIPELPYYKSRMHSIADR